MPAAILVNAFILLIFAVAAILYLVDPGLYYRSAQEDRFLEWLTFWIFLFSAAVFIRNALEQRRIEGGLPWFAAGLGLFCLLVGLEEISWGQRLLAYQPPDYFLERNFQQELNFHNVIDTKLRMLGLQLVLIGYGVVLAALGALRPVRRIAARLYVVPPPVALSPAFAVIAGIYAWYPASFTGEWVEAATGLAFLGVAVLTRPRMPAGGSRPLAGLLAGAAAAAMLTPEVLRFQQDPDGPLAATATAEIAALATDLADPRLRIRCNIHKRLYTFMREYDQPYLLQGEFAALLRKHDASTRAEYLLDPWNSPYWVRHNCRGDRNVAFVYSFGPNRRRDSTDRELRGDDIGATID